MTPYDLEEAIRKSYAEVQKEGFSDKSVITETFVLVRKLVRHAADVEAERLIATRTPQ